jgi:aminomethyltransferase
MCYEDGGIVDDLLVYKMSEEEYMLVVNASNIEKDWEWISGLNSMGADLQNRSDDFALLALQGPNSMKILQKLADTDVSAITFYTFETGTVAGQQDVIISATGYTGEKGFELYIDTKKADAARIWAELLKAGEEYGIEPAGLGARDTLRLEMGFALYGNDISKETNPLEAGLGWLTKLDKGDFVGRDAIKKVKENGIKRKLSGFVIDEGRNVPRSGYTIADVNGNEIGFVTSGTQSVSLEKGIGMGYLDMEHAKEGEKILIQIRKRTAQATVTNRLFIRSNFRYHSKQYES